jgi:hypothetical protein
VLDEILNIRGCAMRDAARKQRASHDECAPRAHAGDIAIARAASRRDRARDCRYIRLHIRRTLAPRLAPHCIDLAWRSLAFPVVDNDRRMGAS